jgi:hypothetical protein
MVTTLKTFSVVNNQQLNHPRHWVVSINELRAHGHFPTLRERNDLLLRVANIMEGGASPPHQHLVRYATWWR